MKLAESPSFGTARGSNSLAETYRNLASDMSIARGGPDGDRSPVPAEREWANAEFVQSVSSALANLEDSLQQLGTASLVQAGSTLMCLCSLKRQRCLLKAVRVDTQASAVSHVILCQII